MSRMTPDRWLGLVTLLAALVVLLVWIPRDVDSGIAEVVRRRTVLGDALAPTVAATLLALAGLGLLIGRGAEDVPRLDMTSLRWMLSLCAVMAVSLALMRWTGPAAAALLGAGEYRLLRADLPWKYLGFLIGGTLMIFALTSLAEGRIRPRRLALAFAAALIMALLYDLPFDDLQLPPNGDV
jgi:hypothetical protein